MYNKVIQISIIINNIIYRSFLDSQIHFKNIVLNICNQAIQNC